jgi:N-acetylglutamate synthase-like GNAT family acetyltransferase
MEALIRRYNRADKEACLMAFRSNVPLYFAEHEVEEFENFLDHLLPQEASEGQEKSTRFFVLLADKQIIACGGFGDKDNTGVVSLAWGLVHKDFHKKGFGKQLLLHRLAQIKLLHPTLPVSIDTTQHSAPFFEKYGFETRKQTMDYYAVGMHRYDMTLKDNDKTKL